MGEWVLEEADQCWWELLLVVAIGRGEDQLN